MENAVDALKMAAGVLVFVLALSISINAFGETRKAAQAVLDMNDKAVDYDFDFAYLENGTTERVVGIETIIPSIYKSYKENYKIIFIFHNIDYYLYKKYNMNENINNDSIGHEQFSIDLENEVLGNDTDKETFIKALLYGSNVVGNYPAGRDYTDTLKNEYRIKLHSDVPGKVFYEVIKDMKFKEKIGVYYQEELGGATEDNPEANKTKKRVITYEEV